MALHPQSKLVIDYLALTRPTPLEQMTVAEARAQRAQYAEELAALAGPREEVEDAEDCTIPGPSQPIPIRIYRPSTLPNLPALVYFHGGGWVLGNLDTMDRPCRALANKAKCVVISVDYRLAPEHKFPAAVEDAYAAVEHFAGADPIAVGGDSAGANLSAAVTLMARDRSGPRIDFQLLVYPATDYDDDRPALHDYADNHMLTRAGIEWFWGHYLSSADDGRTAYCSPLKAASLEGLPPAMIITAECDPLRDQGEAYAYKLREANVPVILKRYEGAIHGFFQMGAVIDAGREALADSAAALRQAWQDSRSHSQTGADSSAGYSLKIS